MTGEQRGNGESTAAFWWRRRFCADALKECHRENARYRNDLANVSRTHKIPIDFQLGKVLKARRSLVVRDVNR